MQGIIVMSRFWFILKFFNHLCYTCETLIDMTKAEIIEQIVTQTGIDKLAVTATIEAVMETIKNNMVKGENIYLRGFGTFLLKKRADKKGRNITKGTIINIPAHFIPSFKPCKEFVEEVASKVKVK